MRITQDALERIRADHKESGHEQYWVSIPLPLTSEARQEAEAKYGTIYEIDDNYGRHLNDRFWTETTDLSVKRFALEKKILSVQDSLENLQKAANTSTWTLNRVSHRIVCVFYVADVPFRVLEVYGRGFRERQ